MEPWGRLSRKKRDPNTTFPVATCCCTQELSTWWHTPHSHMDLWRLLPLFTHPLKSHWLHLQLATTAWPVFPKEINISLPPHCTPANLNPIILLFFWKHITNQGVYTPVTIALCHAFIRFNLGQIIQIIFDVMIASKAGDFFSVLEIGHIILKVVNLPSKFVIEFKNSKLITVFFSSGWY